MTFEGHFLLALRLKARYLTLIIKRCITKNVRVKIAFALKTPCQFTKGHPMARISCVLALSCLVFCFGCGSKEKPIDLKKMNGFLEAKIADRETEIGQLKSERTQLQKALATEKTVRVSAEDKLREGDRFSKEKEKEWKKNIETLFADYQAKKGELEREVNQLKVASEGVKKDAEEAKRAKASLVKLEEDTARQFKEKMEKLDKDVQREKESLARLYTDIYKSTRRK